MLTKNDELEYWWNVKDTWEDAEAEENEASIHAYWNCGSNLLESRRR